MKSITEILGGAQILFSFSYDPQECFEEYLSEEYRVFLGMLRVVEEKVPSEGRIPGGPGEACVWTGRVSAGVSGDELFPDSYVYSSDAPAAERLGTEADLWVSAGALCCEFLPTVSPADVSTARATKRIGKGINYTWM